MKVSRFLWALCPIAALVWFCISLDARIASDWEYIHRQKQLEFVFFKYGIAALIVAPAFGLACSNGVFRLFLTGAFPALMVTQEAVAAWMIVFTGWARKTEGSLQVSPFFQLMFCGVLTAIGLTFAYGPLLFRRAFRRIEPVRVDR